jgi:hypothetical protein
LTGACRYGFAQEERVFSLLLNDNKYSTRLPITATF